MFKQRILVVDDNALNVAIMKKLLQQQYDVTTAMTGEECLRQIDQCVPDLVLLDIMMPGIDGYTTCQRIKSAPFGEDVQVILVSGKGSTAERLRGYEVHADDYIVKPFDHDELLAKVRVHLRLRLALNDLKAANSLVLQQNEHLESLVEERTSEIMATQDVTVFALAQLAESRDSETGQHLLRMRNYAQLLAEELQKSGPYTQQIDKRFLEDLYRSSPLHDIGKVGIADQILLKPGPLTPGERQVMQEHVVIGAETLEKAAQHTGGGQFLSMAAEIARYHHERFDGSGYWSGRAGQAIPLAARIVALADAYDAITTARAYKPAYDPEMARDIIESESGRHFDPAIVTAFLSRFEEFRQCALSLAEEGADRELAMV